LFSRALNANNGTSITITTTMLDNIVRDALRRKDFTARIMTDARHNSKKCRHEIFSIPFGM
jgi:hypothetical protein